MSTTEAPTYPIKQLFPTDGDDSYPELLPAIEDSPVNGTSATVFRPMSDS